MGAEISLVDLGQEQEVELRKVLDVPDDEDEVDRDSLPHRAPVVTVMGHVDHGKTKLLDRIRNANVVAGEAGGITQHIGAYQVVKDGRPLTFIDTPGHEAFTAMRARGADATDIVVLVVAADDGVMPQTLEAIAHAKAAEVPIVVAVNKIDRENADPNRVMQQLSEQDLVPESWGGDTIVCEVSALQGIGIDELLENLLIVAEVEDLRAGPEGRARGVVVEAHLDIGRGPVATVLVQRGTLRVGDPLVAGAAWGRIRALINDRGEQIKEAGPSTPVEVLGLSDVPLAGDDFVVAPDERKARSVAETRERWVREAARGRDASVTSHGARLEDIFAQIQAGEQAMLNLIVKADVQGSLEAVTESLKKLERPEVKVGFVLRGVGGISESDIQLAATSSATIIGFNVRPGRQAREMADAEGVEIRTYEIIYKLLEDVESAHDRHARAGVRRGRDRRGRGPRGLQGAADRFRCRLHGPVGGHHPGLEGPVPARGQRSSGRARSARCDASRTTSGRWPQDSSAAWACRTSRTSRVATSSRPTTCGRSPAPDRSRRIPALRRSAYRARGVSHRRAVVR